MSGEAAALVPIVGAVDAIDAQLDADDQQLGLWSEPVTEDGRAKLAERSRPGPGRPPGARNKRTEATVAALLQRFRDPRAVALERIQMHPADLAAILGCTVFEAAQEQRLYIGIVAPFLHARITPEVIDNRQVINLRIGSFGAEPGAGAGAGLQLVEGTIEVIEQPAIEQPAAEHPSAKTPSETEA